MDYSNKDIPITAQGRDTPEPVEEGGRAGQLRPLSSDCVAPLSVQGEDANIATGDKKEGEEECERIFERLGSPSKNPYTEKFSTPEGAGIFRRSTKLKRTPPSADVLSAQRESVSLTPESDDERRKRKRKKVNTPPKIAKDPDTVWKSVEETLKIVQNSMTQLDKFCKENRNVHVPVKNMVQKVIGQMENLRKSTKEMVFSQQVEEVEKCKENRALAQEVEKLRQERDGLKKVLDGMSSLTNSKAHSKARLERSNSLGVVSEISDRKEMATQTDPEEINSEQQRIRWENKVQCIVTEEDLRNLINEEITPECHQLEVRSKQITATPDNEDIVLFADLTRNRDHRLVSRLAGGSQAVLKYIREGRITEGKMIYYKSGGEAMLDGKTIREERYIFLVGIGESLTNEMSLLAGAREVREKCQELGRGYIHLAYSGENNSSTARKLIECAFSNFGGTATWHSPNKERRRNNLAFGGEAVIVNVNDGSYADMLKSVKNTLGYSKEAETIKKASKTRNGHLKLEIDGRRGKAEEVVTLLRDRMNLLDSVRSAGSARDKKMIHIYGLDAVTSEEEVKTSMKKYCSEGIIVNNMRPLKYGALQAASVLLDEVTAEKLTKLGEIRIGLSDCKVKMRPDVPICFRCWDVGHMAAHCKGTDRSSLCRNCGEAGHEARECSKSPKCPICNAAGHRANTLKCPKYAEAAEKSLYKKNLSLANRRAAEARGRTPTREESTETTKPCTEGQERHTIEKAQKDLGKSPDQVVMQLD